MNLIRKIAVELLIVLSVVGIYTLLALDTGPSVPVSGYPVSETSWDIEDESDPLLSLVVVDRD